MYDSVMAASLMTHRDIRSLSGALAVSHAVRRLAAGESKDPSLLFRIASDVSKDEKRIGTDHGETVIKIEQHGGSLGRAIAHAESILDATRERALAAIVDEANRRGAEPECKRPTMGFPPACIPACLYLLLATDSFEEAVSEVVNLGGDTDTAGAILARWPALTTAPTRSATMARRIAESCGRRCPGIALAQRSAVGLHIPDLIATEQFLTRKEGESLEQFASAVRNGGDRDANHVL